MKCELHVSTSYEFLHVLNTTVLVTEGSTPKSNESHAKPKRPGNHTKVNCEQFN